MGWDVRFEKKPPNKEDVGNIKKVFLQFDVEFLFFNC